MGDYIKVQGGYAFKSDLFQKTGIPIIRISNLPQNASFVDLTDCVYYEKGQYDNFEVHNGDLLIAMSGATTGKTAVYHSSTLAYLNQRVGLFKSTNSDNLHYPFLYAFVSAPTFKNQLSTRLIAGAQPNISSSDIESIRISIPQNNEQAKIAQLMSLLDERITIQNKIIDKLQSLIKGISSKIFASIQGIEYRMGDIATITNGNSNVQDAITEAKDGLYPFFDRSEDIKYLPTFLFDKEAIIYPGEGADFMPRYFKGKFALHQRCYAIYDFNEIINAQFLYFYLRTKNSYFIRNAVGSTVPSLRLDTFQKLKVIVPSKNTQHSVSLCLSYIEQKCNVENEILQTLLKQKMFLLRQMFI